MKSPLSPPAQELDERIDRLALRTYGTERGGTVEALLNNNRGLVEKMFAIPGGTELNAPDVEVEQEEQIRPWE